MAHRYLVTLGWRTGTIGARPAGLGGGAGPGRGLVGRLGWVLVEAATGHAMKDLRLRELFNRVRGGRQDRRGSLMPHPIPIDSASRSLE